MDDKKEKTDESVSRRSFLTSLGKWSSIVVATAVLGIPEASGSVEGPKEAREPGAEREGVPGNGDGPDESTEPQGWRRRVWVNGGGTGCRVWANGGAGQGCRVWGNR
jgi:hypothetical protein